MLDTDCRKRAMLVLQQKSQPAPHAPAPPVSVAPWWPDFMLLAVVLLVCIGVAAANTPRQPRIELRWGAPTAGYIERAGYVHAPVGRLRTSLWTLEYLDAEKLARCDKARIPRRSSFTIDRRQSEEFRASERDYRAPEWDCGHLSPAANNSWSEEAMADSFLLTNTAPQNLTLNRGAWRQLEEHVRSLAKPAHMQVWVCTLPLWMPSDAPRQGDVARNTPTVTYEVIGGNHVPVPTHWAKCVLIRMGDNGPIELRAWVMPNAELRDAVLDEYRVSCDFLEHWAGVDLWAGLPDQQERELERREP